MGLDCAWRRALEGAHGSGGSEEVGGGGGGGAFYKTVWKLKGFQKPMSHRNKFRYYCEIHAFTNFHPAEKHKI